MTPLPKKAKFVIIGAGIHGLSTAWNIGEKLRAKGLISSMPEGWSYGDNVFARYEKANIKVLTKQIKMAGAIRR